MPCYDPETHERPERLAARVNQLTEMLCGLCTELEKHKMDGVTFFIDGLPEWWKEHKAFDYHKERVKEKYAKGGFASLTNEEQDIWFLDQDVSRRP